MATEEQRKADRDELKEHITTLLDNIAKESERVRQLKKTAQGRRQLAQERAERGAKAESQRAKEQESRRENKKYAKRVKKIKKAAEKSTPRSIKKIVGRGVDSTDLSHAIWSAATKGRLENVKFLCESGASPNLELKSGFTLLMLAVKHGHLEIARYLVAQGAQVNHMDDSQDTALTEAFALNIPSIEMVRFLVSAGAKLDLPGRTGYPALVKAIQEREYGIAEALLVGGADINVTDKNGMTPLMHAVDNDELRAVKWLVKNRARVNVQDNEGRTAAMHIRSYRNPSIEQQLAYAKKKGVDLRTFKSFEEAKEASKAAQVWCHYLPQKKGLSVHVPNETEKILWFLKDNGMDINVQNNKGNTLPILMTLKNHPVNYYFYYGFLGDYNVMLKNKEGKTYLDTSIESLVHWIVYH